MNICFVDSSSTERPSLKEFFWLNYLHRTHDTHTHKHTNIFELNSVNMQHKHTFSRCLYKISHSYLVFPVAFRNRNNTIDVTINIVKLLAFLCECAMRFSLCCVFSVLLYKCQLLEFIHLYLYIQHAQPSSYV